MNKFKNKILIVFISLLVSSCLPASSLQPKTQTNTNKYSYDIIVPYESNSSIPTISRFHDKEAEVTCWLSRSNLETSISCLPDYYLEGLYK